MNRLIHYLFVQKDPLLMAMPYRRLLGAGLIIVGLGHVALGLSLIR